MNLQGPPAESFWLRICEANSIAPYVLEAHRPNCEGLRQAGIRNVLHGDIAHTEARAPDGEPFDIVLWWHGPEHMDKENAAQVIRRLLASGAQMVICGSPLGDEPQDEVYGNPFELHRSAWHTADYAALGMSAMEVHDGRRYPHITAWWCKTTSV